MVMNGIRTNKIETTENIIKINKYISCKYEMNWAATIEIIWDGSHHNAYVKYIQ